ncbi:MAG TPA: T9SS type A sorting domain-containing protein [Puia sp.]|jgi:hypothetical protein|nr:T9SS type A sorting domain-containing protein [Puia sp.]
MRRPFLQSLKIRILSLILIVMIAPGAMAAVISSAGTGNWSSTAWPNTTRTGTITTSTASAIVTGAGGSLFLTEISVGNIIKTAGNVAIGTVLSITSNTTLTLTANAVSTNAGMAYNVQGVGSGDIAQISGGNTITVDIASAACISFQSNPLSPVSPEVLIFNLNSHLTVSGLVTIGDIFGHPVSIDMTNGGILTCGSFLIVTVGTWTPGSGTVELTTTNTLPASFFTSFHNLTITAGTTTTGVGLTINSHLSIADGASFSVGAFALTVTGTTTVGGGTSGNLTVSSATGAKTFTGLVTINVGGVWNNSGNAAIIFQGGITNNGTFTAGTGIQTFNTNAQALTGTFSIPSVTVTAVTLTNNNTLSVTTNLAGSGTLAQAANATLNIVFTGSFGITGLTATANGNNVNYGFAGTQTVFPVSYYNLTLSNTSSKTLLAGTTTISGNLTLSGTASTLAVTGLTIGGNVTIGVGTAFTPSGFTHSVAGNWSRSGTFTAGTSTIIFDGSGVQTITATGGENFANVTINNSGAGIQLVNAVTVATALTMTLGNIDLNGINLTLGTSAASIGTLARIAGTMLGTGSFIRWFNTSTIAVGSVTGLFPTGTAIDYRPFFVSAPATGPTTGGSITVGYHDATTNTSIPTYMDGAATIMVRKDLNWAVTTGNGLAGGTYNLDVQGTDFGVVGAVSDLRLTLANSVVGLPGVNAGTILNPQINRTGLTLASLTNTFYIGSINSVSTPLPVTLVSFTAFMNAGKVDLKWETATETQNDYFTILRSKEGIQWESLENIPGKGNSASSSYYETFDKNPLYGQSFYKLENTDFDGHVYFSPVVMVNDGSLADQVSVYPNPASTHVIISFSGNQPYAIQVFNSAGQLMKVVTNNVLSKTLNVSDLPTGVYFIQIMVGGSIQTKEVIVNR